MSDENLAPLVHAIETTGHNQMPRTYRQHSESACKPEIDATREAYALMSGKNQQKRLDSFDTCRIGAWFVRHVLTGDLRVATKSCKLRWCPLCAKKRSWFLVEQIKPWAESVHRLKFLTLTLKHSDAPLHDQIDNLYTFFQKFRKLKYLKDHMHGGVWFFQIKKSESSGQWHPHLHCLIDAEFMHREKLSQLWQRTTLTSMVVDIRKADDTAKVAEYVGRYSARPSTLAELDIGDRLEMVEALHGRRLMGTWGTAKYKPEYEYQDEAGKILDSKPDDMENILCNELSHTGIATALKKPADAGDWKYIAGWSTVHGCLRDDDNARKIFHAWKMDEPLELGIDMRHIEKYIYNLADFEPKEPPENRQLYLDFSGPLPF